MEQVLAVATSLGTLLMMWLAGRKKSLAWVVGLINQALWVAFIIVFEAWGLILLTVALTYVYTRNLILWRRDEWQRQYESRVRSGDPHLHVVMDGRKGNQHL